MGLLDQFKAYIDANTPRNTRPAVSPKNVIYAGLLQQPIENIKANAAGLLGEIQRAPQDLAALASPQMYAKALKAMNTPQPVDKQKWIDAGMELSGMAPLGGLMAHTVYHGSPHKFDKFDMSKIGTGEGAQAYGHGLYFAESPAVATDYATKLSSAGLAKNKLAQNGGDIDAAITSANERIANYKNLIANGGGGDPRRAQGMLNLAEKDLNDLLAMKSGTLNEAGNLYKVDIPDEIIPRMLDWDKPLSEQPDFVKSLIPDAGSLVAKTGSLPNPVRRAIERVQDGTALGSDFVNRLSYPDGNGAFDPANATRILKELGIPGIRYLDGSSRTAGQGTSNFVLFDDQLPRILEINGQPTGLLSYADEAKAGGLLGVGDNAGMDYVVNSRGSMGHEIVKDGKVVGLVKTGKAKDAIGTFMKQRNDALMAKKAKAEAAAKASSSNRAARKAEIEALNLAYAQYADVISSAHKNKNLEFMPLPDGVFGMKGNPLIHQSPSYGKKPGSSYELVMIDGRPAYARASDHWGTFSTNDFVNGEQVSNTYNWPLSGVETKPYGDIRRSGYVLLDDLLKK